MWNHMYMYTFFLFLLLRFDLFFFSRKWETALLKAAAKLKIEFQLKIGIIQQLAKGFDPKSRLRNCLWTFDEEGKESRVRKLFTSLRFCIFKGQKTEPSVFFNLGRSVLWRWNSNNSSGCTYVPTETERE